MKVRVQRKVSTYEFRVRLRGSTYAVRANMIGSTYESRPGKPQDRGCGTMWMMTSRLHISSVSDRHTSKLFSGNINTSKLFSGIFQICTESRKGRVLKLVPCNYGLTKIAFKLNDKNNANWFAMAIEYTNGDGGFRSVEMAPNGTQIFSPMDNIWGAVWKKDITETFKSPYSFRLTSPDGKTIIASNVIPVKFTNGQKYSSNVNF
ncbi:expansin-B15-like protein [Tanacetum coccineum]